MKLLALDTTLARCSVAYLDSDRSVARSESMQRGHAERIAPMADEVMREAGAGFTALDRIVVTTGPGSFTGLRVGLSFARGLAVALAKPCVGISTLEALALESGEDGPRGAIIAGGGDFYAACYLDGAATMAPRRVSAEEARAALNGVRVRGPAAEQFGGEVIDAPDVAALARRGAHLEPALYPPNPLYLRAALMSAPP